MLLRPAILALILVLSPAGPAPASESPMRVEFPDGGVLEITEPFHYPGREGGEAGSVEVRFVAFDDFVAGHYVEIADSDDRDLSDHVRRSALSWRMAVPKRHHCRLDHRRMIWRFDPSEEPHVVGVPLPSDPPDFPEGYDPEAQEQLASQPVPVKRSIPQFPRRGPVKTYAPNVALILVHVDIDGEVDDMHVVDSYPSGRLAHRARRAARRWEFEPARDADGQPVPAWFCLAFTAQHRPLGEE